MNPQAVSLEGLVRVAYVTCYEKEAEMPLSGRARVKVRRDKMRAEGLRPLQIWVPDTRAPGFAEQCRLQSLLVAKSNAADQDLIDFMDAALADFDEDDP